MQPLFSLLTPAIWPRVQQASALAETVQHQITTLGIDPGLVEHLVLFDNKSRSIGLKRQALFEQARGLYIAFCDDDDTIAPDYLAKILTAIQRGRDVITFTQTAIINGTAGQIEFRADSPNGDVPWKPGETVIRPPWHVCAWRRSILHGITFTDKNYGEDIDWCLQARPRIRTATHIDSVLHTYHYDEKLTAAPAP